MSIQILRGFLVISPLVVGTLIYLLLRPDSLIIFTIIRSIDTTLIDAARLQAEELSALLPGWALWSLPNALWVFSFTFVFHAIWRKHIPRIEALMWMSLPGVLSIGFEVGQHYGLVSGTFDVFDLLWITIGGTLGHGLSEAVCCIEKKQKVLNSTINWIRDSCRRI